MKTSSGGLSCNLTRHIIGTYNVLYNEWFQIVTIEQIAHPSDTSSFDLYIKIRGQQLYIFIHVYFEGRSLRSIERETDWRLQDIRLKI